METLNVEIVCDGDSSSATFVIRNILKRSRHNCSLHQWNAEYREDTDIIYFHYGGILTDNSSIVENFLKKKRDYKWIAGIRGRLNFKRWLKNGGFHDFVFLLDGVSCANERFRVLSEEKGLSNVFVCHSGVDTEAFSVKPPPKEFCIGWAGSGYAGSKMFGNFLRLPFPKRTSAYDFGTSRKFVDMPSFYDKVGVYVSTSVEEGSPLPPKEAASSGRPVVAIDVGDLCEWVPKEWLVPNFKDSYKLLIPLIEQLRDDEELYLRECKRFREIIENWDYSIIVNEYDSMFSSVCSSG